MITGMRVTCEELVRELPDLLDREVEADRAAELEEHLEECDRCLRTFRFERALIDQIRARLRATSLSPGLVQRVLTSIEETAESRLGDDAKW